VEVKEPVAEVAAPPVAEAKPKARRPRKVKPEAPPTAESAEAESHEPVSASESE
jgi:hypothetical protein